MELETVKTNNTRQSPLSPPVRFTLTEAFLNSAREENEWSVGGFFPTEKTIVDLMRKFNNPLANEVDTVGVFSPAAGVTFDIQTECIEFAQFDGAKLKIVCRNKNARAIISSNCFNQAQAITNFVKQVTLTPLPHLQPMKNGETNTTQIPCYSRIQNYNLQIWNKLHPPPLTHGRMEHHQSFLKFRLECNTWARLRA